MNYTLVLLDGSRVYVGKYCTYRTISRSSSRNSRNQHCDVLETIVDNNDDCSFIEIDTMLIPIRSILYVLEEEL